MRLRLLATSALALVLFANAGGVAAQDAPAVETPDAVTTETAAAEAETADSLLSEDALDELVAPIALYPDLLLTQVLVASTYPLDIVKADRFITTQADLTDQERADAAEQQDWDPSVQVLAAGFPTVVTKMATELDWTQELGDAMLAQSDDVLDFVQRQRARAVAIGNLSTNEAQVVDETDDNITIEPAAEDVVYVPQYDATTAYTTPYTQPAYVATADTGYSTSNLITTGAIAFGSALLIDEIFDDDDDDWDNYWHHDNDYNDIDWDEGDIRPRPDVDINGDVNIDRSRDRTRVNVDGDRTDIDRTRIGDDAGNRAKWTPSEQSRADARDRVAERERAKDRQTPRTARTRGPRREPPERRRRRRQPPERRRQRRREPPEPRRQRRREPPERRRRRREPPECRRQRRREPPERRRRRQEPERRGRQQQARGAGRHQAADARPRRAAGDRKAPPKAATMETPFSPKKADAKKSNAAVARGNQSLNKASAKPQVKAPSKAVSRPKTAKPPAHKAAPKSSAFKKSSSGSRAKASSSRGHKSGGGGRGGGGGKRR